MAHRMNMAMFSFRGKGMCITVKTQRCSEAYNDERDLSSSRLSRCLASLKMASPWGFQGAIAPIEADQ
jgi:hypothetical protein